MNSRTEPWPFVTRPLTPKLGAAGIACLALCASLSCRAEDFVLQVASPKFKVNIPGVPQMKMDVHPKHASQPHLRYLGADGDVTVSVFTPAASAGMTPLECAAATLRTLVARPGVPPAAEIYRARLNGTTFIAAYAARHGGTVQVHAHLLSAAGGTHCVEVHTTKTTLAEEEIPLWLNALQKASIEPD